MSEYLNFSLRNGDSFTPFLTYQSCNYIFDAFKEHVPYGKVRPVTFKMLRDIYESVNEDIKAQEKVIKKLYDMKDEIRASNCTSIEEKYDLIYDIFTDIDEQKDCVRHIKEVVHIINILKDMLTEADFTKYEDGVKMDPNHYIYVGIECYCPSIDDIIAEEESA